MRKITPEERVTIRQMYVRKMMNEVRKRGFLTLTIPEIAKLMNISRASLYNYFSSKEDIVTEVINVYTAYLDEANEIIRDESLSYTVRLQKVFEQGVLSAYYTSDVFLEDLKASCPPLYDKKMSSHKESSTAVQAFYKKGMMEGVFHPNHPKILIMRDESALKTLLNTSFLQDEGLSLKQALRDYYEGMTLLFKPEALPLKNAQSIDQVVKPILARISGE